jgi:imidazolonepropionase-like amidohydrolase
MEGRQQYKAGLEVAKRNLKTLVDRGVRIAFGTDTGTAGDASRDSSSTSSSR